MMKIKGTIFTIFYFVCTVYIYKGVKNRIAEKSNSLIVKHSLRNLDM